MPALSPFIIVFIGLLFSQLTFGAACPSSSSATSAGAAYGDNCTVTGSSSVMQLNFQNGFNDASVVTAAGGNNGTTVGAQRKLSFIKSAEILAEQVVSTQTILVDANFDSTMSCSAFEATLGSAGATTNIGYPAETSGLLGNTYYPIGLANAITGSDIDTGVSDITSSFNADLGDSDCLSGIFWYYGFDAPSGSDIGFTTVLLHEITHGLGFASLTDASDGSKAAGIDDIFSNFLYSKQDSADWSIAGGLSDSDRADSAVSGTGLLWNGSNVNTQAIGLLTAGYDDADTSSSFTSGDRVQMYAPNPVEGGSSVSHFTTAASPNEIMEPQYTAGQLNLGLALYLLKDIGWGINIVNNAPTITAVDQSTNEDVTAIVDVSSWGSDSDGDLLSYSITTCPTNISCSVSGSDISLVPDANHNGSTHSVTISVSDGNGGSASDSFNFNVIAQNDDPVIESIPNQNIKDGDFKDIDLSTYSSDIDGDGLTFSYTACGANLTCSFPSSSVLRVSASAGVGTTVSVTVEADDSNGGTNSDTFDVTISSSVPSTTIEVSGTSYNDGDSITLPIPSSQIDVNNGSGNYTYSLSYNSADVSDLISSNSTGLEIDIPSTGEFAGDYTLTITDSTDGDVITITVTRPLRLNWSATSLLNGDTDQTLAIEGGASGTVYSLVQSGSADLVFLDSSNISITSATAENNATTFNAAVIYLDSEAVTDISSMDVTVQSSYDDVVEADVKVYPASSHNLNVKNSDDEALSNSFGELIGGEALLTEMNLATNYSTDSNGEFTVLLPDTSVLAANTTFEMRISASGYNSETLSLDSDTISHNVVLTQASNAITLTGSIRAVGTQDLLQNPPEVELIYGDNTSDIISVSATSSTLASFSHEVDLNLKSLQLLSVSQSESVTIELNVSNVTTGQNFDITLSNDVSIAVTTTVDTTSGSSGGGSFSFLSLFLFVILLLSIKRVKMQRKLGE